MAIKRIRASRLLNAGQVASEHAEVWRKLKQGKLEPALASRMSAILVNHRTILESTDVEKRMGQIEERLVQLLNAGSGNVLQFRKAAGGLGI